MAGRECYHCKQWVEEGEAHDCWTTTEGALTADLSEDLREAWGRVRETAAGFGEQRIYASHSSIMFSRTSCYFFVRPKKSFLEVCVFLGRPLKAPQVRRSEPSSKSKFYNIIQIRHRDEVEAPITDWLREAYEYSGRGGSSAFAKAAADRRSSKSGGRSDPPARTVASLEAPAKAAPKPSAASRKTEAKRSAPRTRKAKRPSRAERSNQSSRRCRPRNGRR